MHSGDGARLFAGRCGWRLEAVAPGLQELDAGDEQRGDELTGIRRVRRRHAIQLPFGHQARQLLHGIGSARFFGIHDRRQAQQRR